MIVFTDRVVVPAHVMVRFLDNESVFLNLETERYFRIGSNRHAHVATAHVRCEYRGSVPEDPR